MDVELGTKELGRQQFKHGERHDAANGRVPEEGGDFDVRSDDEPPRSGQRFTPLTNVARPRTDAGVLP